VAWDILPGNTADKAACRALISRLRTRFRIGRVLVVADRGVIAASTIALLAEHAIAPFDFILGCTLRWDKEVAQTVLARPGRFHPVAPNLEVKEVRVGSDRYVVCRKPEEAVRDVAARAAILVRPRNCLKSLESTN
jgi:hypothetical protein